MIPYQENMPVLELEREYLSSPSQSAGIKPLQTPDNVIFFNHHRLIELTGNLEVSLDLQKAGWDSAAEIKRFIGDVNLGLIKGLTPEQAVVFSTQILTDHIRFYDAEFIKQEPVLPHRNYFGFWQSEKRLLGNNSRPVIDSVDAYERMGSVKRAAKKVEDYLLEAENNSFVVSMSAKGPSGYLDENGSDVPYLNTYILVDWKDENGNLKGITLVTDLTIDQAEKVMADLGAPANFLAKKGTQMQRVVNILENPAMPSLPEAYHNPLEFVFDAVLAVRGEGDIYLQQKNGKVEIRPVVQVRQKIATYESLLDLNTTTDRLVKEIQDFVLANYQQVGDPSFQQKIIDMAQETVLLFTKYYRKHHQSNLSICSFDRYAKDDREIIRIQRREDIREIYRQEIALLQTRAGCPNAVKRAAGRSAGVGGVLIFGESDSMGSLYFACPVCGAVNKRPWEGYVDSCQSCGSKEVACGPSSAQKEEKQDDYQLKKAA